MNWYVLYVKHRNEKKVALQLEALGVTVFCHLFIKIRQRSDRKKQVEMPLINSFVCVKFKEKERQRILDEEQEQKAKIEREKQKKIDEKKSSLEHEMIIESEINETSEKFNDVRNEFKAVSKLLKKAKKKSALNQEE